MAGNSSYNGQQYARSSQLKLDYKKLQHTFGRCQYLQAQVRLSQGSEGPVPLPALRAYVCMTYKQRRQRDNYSVCVCTLVSLCTLEAQLRSETVKT